MFVMDDMCALSLELLSRMRTLELVFAGREPGVEPVGMGARMEDLSFNEKVLWSMTFYTIERNTLPREVNLTLREVRGNDQLVVIGRELVMECVRYTDTETVHTDYQDCREWNELDVDNGWSDVAEALVAAIWRYLAADTLPVSMRDLTAAL